MSEKLRVLHRKHRISTDGASILLLRFAEHLSEDVVFDYLLREEPDIEFCGKIKVLGGKVYVVPKRRIKTLFLRYVYRYKVLHSYSIIHISTDDLGIWKVLLFAKLAGVKRCILHSHNSQTEGKKYTAIEEKFYRKLNGILVDDCLACSKMAGEYMFGKNRKFEIVRNAIDIDKFRFDAGKRKNLRKQLGLDDNFVIGHIGRFVEQKNHDFSVDVFAEVLRRRPEARLLLVGGGELMNDIKQKVECLGLTDKVIFTGLVSNPEDYYQAMDCFVLPSLFEGLGIVLIEAQANGLPCLYSDVVPEEAALTDLAQQLPLSVGAEKWAEKICGMHVPLDRTIYADRVAEAGYDINVEAKKLERFYLTGKFDTEFTISRGGNTLR